MIYTILLSVAQKTLQPPQRIAGFQAEEAEEGVLL
jgi:hypothetical protein